MSGTQEVAVVDGTYLEKLKKNIEDTVMVKPNCKICNSKNRLEVEKLYDQGRNFTYIFKWLEQNEDPVCYNSVRSHFKEHYERQKIALMVNEYTDNLSKYRIDQVDEIDRLETRRSMFEKSLLTLSAINDTTTDGEELRKNATALKNLNDSIINIEKQIDAIKKEHEPIILVLKTLQVLINESINETDSQAVKKALVELLDNFKERVDGLLLD